MHKEKKEVQDPAEHGGRLELKRQTIRRLDEESLEQVVGGLPSTCSATICYITTLLEW